MSVQDTIRDQVKSNRVVLYMKGTPQFPQCGFSATVVEILKRTGVNEYLAVDVLKDPEIRQGHQGLRELADDSPALRRRRVRRRLRHPSRDVRSGRAAAGLREAPGLTPRRSGHETPPGMRWE